MGTGPVSGLFPFDCVVCGPNLWSVLTLTSCQLRNSPMLDRFFPRAFLFLWIFVLTLPLLAAYRKNDVPWRGLQGLYYPIPMSFLFLLWRFDGLKVRTGLSPALGLNSALSRNAVVNRCALGLRHNVQTGTAQGSTVFIMRLESLQKICAGGVTA